MTDAPQNDALKERTHSCPHCGGGIVVLTGAFVRRDGSRGTVYLAPAEEDERHD